MPRPSEYKAIEAWGRKMGSQGYYIHQEQTRAVSTDAPLDAYATKHNDDGSLGWWTLGNLENLETLAWWEANQPVLWVEYLDNAQTRAVRAAARYVGGGGARCPHCGCDQIDGGSVDFEGNQVFQQVGCVDCDRTWTDIYRLVAVDLHDENDEPEHEPENVYGSDTMRQSVEEDRK